MKNSVAISIKNLVKDYISRDDRTFKELLPSLILGKPWAKKHRVFDKVSLEIPKGQSLGIIGRNGSGKSTLLKLIAGVTYPTSGEINIDGPVAPLIELGAGFHHELTGYENIYLNAAILGMTKQEIEKRLEDIIEFSGIRDSIHMPVKRYSSGMYMRLGFSIAVHTDAPILLIDEVLAVGDKEFQEKCLAKLVDLKDNEQRTIVFVSHDENAVRSFCDRVVAIEKGIIICDGTPKEALTAYHKILV